MKWHENQRVERGDQNHKITKLKEKKVKYQENIKVFY